MSGWESINENEIEFREEQQIGDDKFLLRSAVFDETTTVGSKSVITGASAGVFVDAPRRLRNTHLLVTNAPKTRKDNNGNVITMKYYNPLSKLGGSSVNYPIVDNVIKDVAEVTIGASLGHEDLLNKRATILIFHKIAA
jgi:hypothetical protein